MTDVESVGDGQWGPRVSTRCINILLEFGQAPEQVQERQELFHNGVQFLEAGFPTPACRVPQGLHSLCAFAVDLMPKFCHLQCDASTIVYQNSPAVAVAKTVEQVSNQMRVKKSSGARD